MQSQATITTEIEDELDSDIVDMDIFAFSDEF
jgi:hypothetical protein